MQNLGGGGGIRCASGIMQIYAMCAHACVTRQSNMACILSLTDDCLHRGVSFIDDPSSFHSIALTCKRHLQITSNTRSVLHTNLVRLKAEYFIKCFVVENGCDYDKFCRFRDFLNESARRIEVKGMLSYDKVIKIWQRNGPVVAKLFTWFRDKASKKVNQERYVLPNIGR